MFIGRETKTRILLTKINQKIAKVSDLGGHLDTTFREWSSNLAAWVRLVISRLVLIFALPLDFHGRVRVVRCMYLLAALHGIEASILYLLLIASVSLRPLFSGSWSAFG